MHSPLVIFGYNPRLTIKVAPAQKKESQETKKEPQKNCSSYPHLLKSSERET